jgi:ketosteroid isomerase-like protein
MERSDVERWVEGYEAAWRTAGVDGLADLFAPDVSYRPSPWAEPVAGLDALARFWDAAREGPDETFDLASDVVAVDGATAVVRLAVDYAGRGGRWRDLWVVTFGPDGRCVAFEEWPFSPDQPDGH